MAGQKNGKEGYVLGWVVIMVLVLMILVTAILFASTAYYRQSFREYNDRQAYLTARSIVQTAAADFTGSGSGELRDVLLDEISVYLKDEPDSESQAAPPDEAADKPTDKPTDKPDTGVSDPQDQVPAGFHDGKLYHDRLLYAGRGSSDIDCRGKEGRQYRNYDGLSSTQSGVGGGAMGCPGDMSGEKRRREENHET